MSKHNTLVLLVALLLTLQGANGKDKETKECMAFKRSQLIILCEEDQGIRILKIIKGDKKLLSQVNLENYPIQKNFRFLFLRYRSVTGGETRIIYPDAKGDFWICDIKINSFLQDRKTTEQQFDRVIPAQPSKNELIELRKKYDFIETLQKK